MVTTWVCSPECVVTLHLGSTSSVLHGVLVLVMLYGVVISGADTEMQLGQSCGESMVNHNNTD